ncbi:MAG: hypothetical protein HW374_621 [Bacteroidetes bacterium]|nr:hypothetical protein [Bacteroidota bacterium]
MNRSIWQKISLFGIFLFAAGLPISFVPAEFGIALAVVGWFGEGIFNRHWQLKWHSFFIPLLFYIGWNIIASAFSPRVLHSLWALADNEWALCMMIMMYWVIDDRETLMKVAYTFLAISSLNMAYGLLQTVTGVEFYRNMPLDLALGVYRAVGFQGFYLTFAAFAMATFFLSSSLFLTHKGRMKLWLAGLSIASFLAVILTFARSIWLSFLIAIPAFGFHKSKRFGLMVTGGLAGILVLVLTLSPLIRDRAASIFDLEQNETRLNLWKTSVNIFKDYPLTGVGEDNFDYYFERYKVAGYYDTAVHPHNDYLNVLVSSGFPGLIAFLSLWVLTIKEGFKASKSASDDRIRAIALGSMLTILGFLIGGFFQNYYGTFANCLEWWFVTGLVFTSAKLGEIKPT